MREKEKDIAIKYNMAWRKYVGRYNDVFYITIFVLFDDARSDINRVHL